MNAIRNTLPGSTRKASVALLNFTGLNLFQLPTRPKQTHWNVLALTFIRLHLLDEPST
jgi:DNA-binding ferritin-like protein